MPANRSPLFDETRTERQNYDDSCFRYKKNQPQINSINGPMMIMYVSGTHIAWSSVVPTVIHQNWAQDVSTSEQSVVYVAWYIGAIIGSILLFILNDKLSKKKLYITAGIVCLLSSSLMIVFHSNAYGLILVRLLAGIAYGLVFISAIIHGSENSVNAGRAKISSYLQLGLYPGMVFYIILVSIGDMDPAANGDGGLFVNQLIGGLNALFSVVACVFPIFFTRESVVALESRGDRQQALANMSRLRREPQDNSQIQYDIQEINAMISEDKEQNLSPFDEGNGRVVLMAILGRLLMVLSMNYAINMIQFQALDIFAVELTPHFLGVFVRCFVMSILILLVDKLGRKLLLLISGGASAICLIAITTVYLLFDETSSQLLGVLFLAFNVAAGLGVAFIPDIVLGEAFPMNKKLSSAIVACIVENALQMILIGTLHGLVTTDFAEYVLIGSSVLFVIAFVVLGLMFPQIPKKSTLRTTRYLYKSPEGKRFL